MSAMILSASAELGSARYDDMSIVGTCKVVVDVGGVVEIGMTAIPYVILFPKSVILSDKRLTTTIRTNRSTSAHHMGKVAIFFLV